MLAVSMPNFAHLARRWWRPPQNVGPRPFLAAAGRQQPLARGVRVGHGLERGEGLRGDDEKRLRRIEIAHRLGDVRAVDIGDEAEGHRAVAVVSQRFVRHHGPEVRAADADIDHIPDAPAGMAFPRPAAHPLGEAAIRSSTAWTSGTTLRPS